MHLTDPTRERRFAPGMDDEEAVLVEVGRFGPRTPAELLAAVALPPARVIDATVRLTVRGLLRIDGDRFAVRRAER